VEKIAGLTLFFAVFWHIWIIKCRPGIFLFANFSFFWWRHVGKVGSWMVQL